MAVRRIDVREKVMAKNDELAAQVRDRLHTHGVPSLNLVSSPGSGKTSLLERTLDALGDRLRMAVVTGDVQTQNDADRLAVRTDRLVQAVVTGGACHMDARQISTALDQIDLEDTDLVFVENVGNLVCPASWDLGEEAKVVIFSVTEGEDKPLKYPRMFERSNFCVINKIDLLPYLPFDMDRAVAYAAEVNPDLRFFFTSALTEEGMGDWYEFLVDLADTQREARLEA
jgi:hydrogenase nickel incorporation protein HypB